MYQIGGNKRFTVRIRQSDRYEKTLITFYNVTIEEVNNGFVAFKDTKGKLHIYTGGAIGIYITEE